MTVMVNELRGAGVGAAVGGAAVVVAVTVIVATPLAFAAEVNVSCPLGSMAGWTAKRAGVSAVTVNVTFWDGLGRGSGEIAVTQPAIE